MGKLVTQLIVTGKRADDMFLREKMFLRELIDSAFKTLVLR